MRFDIADTGIREDRTRVIFESREPLSKIANLSDRKFRRETLNYFLPYLTLLINNSSILNVVVPPPPPHPPNTSPMTNLVLTL